MENCKKDFINNISGGDLCYYPLLYKAIKETKKGNVLEFGMGHGSTPLLNKWCTKYKRNLFSYDFNEEWREKFNSLLNKLHVSDLVLDWNTVYQTHLDASVIFVDQSPGEERKHSLVTYQHTKGIVVIHDSEPTGAGDYRVRELFNLYKYKVDVPTAGAWATALSNEYDLTKWVGAIGNYTIQL